MSSTWCPDGGIILTQKVRKKIKTKRNHLVICFSKTYLHNFAKNVYVEKHIFAIFDQLLQLVKFNW